MSKQIRAGALATGMTTPTPITYIFGDSTTAVQSPGLVATPTTAFVPLAQHVSVFGWFENLVNTITFTLEHQDGLGNWEDVGGPRHLWTREITAGAFFGIMPFDGYAFIPGDAYRISFVTDVGGVFMYLGVIVTDDDVNERTVPILEEIITSITGAQATHDAAVIALGPQNMLSARSTQAAAVANGDAARVVGNLYGEQVPAQYDWANQTARDEEQNPLDTRDTINSPVAVVNLADGALHTVYYSMLHLQHKSLQVTISAPGDTVNLLAYMSNQTIAGEPATITRWSPITVDLWGVTPLTNAAGAINRGDFIDTSVSANWIAITYQRVAGAANDADINIDVKTWY